MTVTEINGCHSCVYSYENMLFKICVLLLKQMVCLVKTKSDINQALFMCFMSTRI